MELYKYRLVFRVSRSFEFPYFQGVALRNLLSGFKTREPELNRFFFETHYTHRQNHYQAYTVQPEQAGRWTYHKNATFSFILTLFGKPPAAFSNVLQLMCLQGFTTLPKCLEIQSLENIVSPQNSIPIVAFSESKPYRFESNTFNTNDLHLKMDTPICIKNNRKAHDFSFDKLINSAAHRANALAVLFGNGEALFDVESLSEQAQKVEMVNNNLEPFFAKHYTKNIVYQAFVGDILYRGDIEPFLPLLHLTEQIHLGKESTSGMGKFSIVSSE